MANCDALRVCIAESGLKQTFIAEKLGMSQQTLTRKLQGQFEFKQSEIVQLSKLLQLTQDEVLSIFFT